MTKRGIIFLVGIIVFIASCVQKDKFDIDVSNIDLDIKINRLDKEIFEVDLDNMVQEAEALNMKYGEFFELYNNRIINIGSPYNREYPELLMGFVTDYTMNKVYQKAALVFPDISKLESDLLVGFKRYKYYFPTKTVPAVYTYIGGFNQSVVIADSIVGVGLDKYLGSDCEFYDRLQIEHYLRKNMTPEIIAPDVLKSWILTEFTYNDSIDNLVNNLIYLGKVQYALDAMFPELSDTLKFGFTAEQMRWCITNEKQMWDFLIDQKLLFSTDYMLINKHINPAPFTAGYPRQSPGRASVWLGWKIVQAYMQRNSDITLNELMINDNYQQILSESRYEP